MVFNGCMSTYLWWQSAVKTQQVFTTRAFIQRHASSYVTYLSGELNVILSAPHGGYEWPEDIPDRTAGAWDGQRCIWRHDAGPKDMYRCAVINQPDKYTEELALCLREDLKQKTGLYPHVILNRLARAKLDPNRPEDKGTFDVPVAVAAWHQYHSYIRQAKAAIGGPGLLVDIHGHGHKTPIAELGYLVTGPMLDSNDFNPEYSSVHSLVKRTGYSLQQLLTGPNSLGSLLTDHGFPAIPSSSRPGPAGRRYHQGGFITRMHGSQDGGQIDAVQVESPLVFRLPGTQQAYCKALAEAINHFMDTYYRMDMYYR